MGLRKETPNVVGLAPPRLQWDLSFVRMGVLRVASQDLRAEEKVMTWNAFKMKTSKADQRFSLFIRFRDDWTCQVCRWRADETNPSDRAYLHCCHFFGRGNQSMRFDPQNAFAGCSRCHTNHLLGPGHALHEETMKRILGPRDYDLLWVRGHATGKRSDETLMRLFWAEELKRIGVDPKTGNRFPMALR